MTDLEAQGSAVTTRETTHPNASFENLNTKTECSDDDEKNNVFYENNSVTTLNGEVLQKGLKNRHIQLIALGGCIGTGLFVNSGLALYTCGPAPLFMAYTILSIVIWFVMNIMAEMATFLPVPGAGAQQFISDYTDPSFGFALGYNYWYGFTVMVAAEVVAGAYVIQYWTESVNIAVWITVLLAVILILNLCPVKVYGETEFYFASIKLLAMSGLIIVGLVLFFGGGPNHDRLGFRYWKHGNAFHQHLVPGNTGRFLAFWTGIIKASYSFIMAPELIVACSGETTNPRKSLPRCANQFVYRLAFFFIMGALVAGVIADSNSRSLSNGSGNASASPFVLGIQNAGIPVLNHIINAAILTSATSSGNSFLYAGSRTLYSLSTKGLAPRFFSRVNKWGVPYYSVAASFAIACISYLNVSNSSAQVFTWLTNLTTISGFIAWIFATIAYLRWRKGVSVQGLSDRVPYRTILQPFGAWFVLIFITIVTITNGYAVFFDFNAPDFLAAYITIPLVLFLYVGHRAYSYFYLGRTRWLTPPEEFDFSRLDSVEYEASQFVEPQPKNAFDRVVRSFI
ncbi:hypothetical protein OXX80_000430 [Metschnikowia pulcherrima]